MRQIPTEKLSGERERLGNKNINYADATNSLYQSQHKAMQDIQQALSTIVNILADLLKGKLIQSVLTKASPGMRATQQPTAGPTTPTPGGSTTTPSSKSGGL